MINKIKKYFVIGNPIEHSLSPLLHNHWIKIKNLQANYNKEKLALEIRLQSEKQALEQLYHDKKKQILDEIHVI